MAYAVRNNHQDLQRRKIFYTFLMYWMTLRTVW